MRTDCHIEVSGQHRLPGIDLLSPGRNAFVERGDLVWWRDGEGGMERVGRVIGFVTAHDLGAEQPHLCVAMMLGDTCCERWVDRRSVFDCRSLDNCDKLLWLFGQGFLDTQVDEARCCFDLLTEEMVP